jgi:hypothetical protein
MQTTKQHRSDTVFKCISCGKETAKDGPICTKRKCCLERFNLLTEYSRNIFLVQYARIRKEYRMKTIDKLKLHSLLQRLQHKLNDLVKQHAKELENEVLTTLEDKNLQCEQQVPYEDFDEDPMNT